jgi:hypothetical protein
MTKKSNACSLLLMEMDGITVKAGDTLNYRGDREYKTACGGFCTLFAYTLVFYLAYKTFYPVMYQS